MTNLNTNLSFKGTLFERNKPPSHIPEKDEIAILESLENAINLGLCKLDKNSLNSGRTALLVQNNAGKQIIVTTYSEIDLLTKSNFSGIIMEKGDRKLDLTTKVLNSATDTINSNNIREKVTRVAKLIKNKVAEIVKLDRTENIEPDQSSDTTDFIV